MREWDPTKGDAALPLELAESAGSEIDQFRALLRRLRKQKDMGQGTEYACGPKEKGKQPCFVAGTLIATPFGLVPIEEITIRQQVLSFDIESLRIVVGDVTRTWITADKPYLSLEMSNREPLLVTAEHPFYVRGRGFVPAVELNEGDNLVGLRGLETPSTELVVVRHLYVAGTADVYNFSVKEYVNYFANNVLVHNY
jgi:hypothetical protein